MTEVPLGQRDATCSGGFEDFMRNLYKKPDNVKALLKITTLNQVYYGIACVHARADIVQISDPSSGDAVLPKVWEEFGLPYTRTVVQALKDGC